MIHSGSVSCTKVAPAGPAGPQGATGPALTGVLQGFISHYDPSGAMITTDLAGVIVSIDETAQAATTDVNGFYSFTGLTTGVYNLSIKPITTTFNSVSATYGPTKIQSIAFTGGGNTYRNTSISLVPTGSVSSMVTNASAGSIQISGVVSPVTSYNQEVTIYVGAPSSTTVDSSTTDFISYYTTSVAANTSSYSISIPVSDFYNLGYPSGGVANAYFAAYLIAKT